MELIYCDSDQALSERASSIMLEAMSQNPSLLLCPATGKSPQGAYALFLKKVFATRTPYLGLRIVMLDEWAGIPADHCDSCSDYLSRSLLKPLNITEDRLIRFHPEAPDRDQECRRVQKVLAAHGPIDLCVLGLGANGHIGFNEPSAELNSHAHVAQLSESSMAHSMISDRVFRPTAGFTLGLKDILQSKHILFLVTGPLKRTSFKRFLKGKISTSLPASFLHLSGNLTCLALTSSVDPIN